MKIEKHFVPGDRVRIRKPRSEYTGCRGTVSQQPGSPGREVAPLGYFVAIDGENGVTRPFLVADLELLEAARVRRVRRARGRSDGRAAG